jgi:hypothetical protein
MYSYISGLIPFQTNIIRTVREEVWVRIILDNLLYRHSLPPPIPSLMNICWVVSDMKHVEEQMDPHSVLILYTSFKAQIKFKSVDCNESKTVLHFQMRWYGHRILSENCMSYWIVKVWLNVIFLPNNCCLYFQAAIDSAVALNDLAIVVDILGVIMLRQ